MKFTSCFGLNSLIGFQTNLNGTSYICVYSISIVMCPKPKEETIPRDVRGEGAITTTTISTLEVILIIYCSMADHAKLILCSSQSRCTASASVSLLWFSRQIKQVGLRLGTGDEQLMPTDLMV